MGGEIVHSFANPVMLQKDDMFGMMITDDQSHLTFYHKTSTRFRKEVGSLHLKKLKGWDHTPWSKTRLRWAVTLGESASYSCQLFCMRATLANRDWLPM
jgi:hypothetical protein